jgi:hypothetical protein
MINIMDFKENFLNDPKIGNKLTPELTSIFNKIFLLDDDVKIIDFLIDLVNWTFQNNVYYPEIYNLIFDNVNILFSLEEPRIKIVLESLNFWQDWKNGLKLVEKIVYSIQISPQIWLLIADYTFKLGLLCYNLFKGSNYALTLLFFEKTLNFLSKVTNDDHEKVLLLLSASIWHIGQIEFENGYSIKASEYQLSSLYYQKNLSSKEYEEYFQSDKFKIRNTFIIASFQAATDFFIATKVTAQLFQNEYAKNYLNHSYSFINRILRIITSNETDFTIIEQIRTFLRQLHTVIDKEGLIQNHSCDFNLLSAQQIEISNLIDYVNNHISSLGDFDKKIFWLSILDQGGLVLFEYDFEESRISTKNTLYSSFIYAITKWGQVELNAPAKELNFLGNTFMIEELESIELIAVVSKPSPEYRRLLRNFASSFEKEFGNILNSNWNGNTSIFHEKGKAIINDLKTSILDI